MTGQTIRRMLDSDLDVVLTNERRAYTHPWSEGIFRDCLKNGNDCFVLEASSRLIGHGVLSVGAGEAHLLNVCVHPDCHGHGFGCTLVEHLIQEARNSRATTMFLEVRPSNVVACKLYENLGFNEVGVRENYYPAFKGREDALVLAIELL